MAGIAIGIECRLGNGNVRCFQVGNRVIRLAWPIGVASDATLSGGVAAGSAWERGRPTLRVVMADTAGRVPFFGIPVRGHIAREGCTGCRVPGLRVGLGGCVAAGTFS